MLLFSNIAYYVLICKNALVFSLSIVLLFVFSSCVKSDVEESDHLFPGQSKWDIESLYSNIDSVMSGTINGKNVITEITNYSDWKQIISLGQDSVNEITATVLKGQITFSHNSEYYFFLSYEIIEEDSLSKTIINHQIQKSGYRVITNNPNFPYKKRLILVTEEIKGRKITSFINYDEHGEIISYVTTQNVFVTSNANEGILKAYDIISFSGNNLVIDAETDYVISETQNNQVSTIAISGIEKMSLVLNHE